MNNGMMQELHRTTRAAHARLEQIPYSLEVVTGRAAIESYLGHLRAFTLLHGVVEQAAMTSSDPRIRAVWRPDLRSLPFLDADLSFFELRAVAEIPAAAEAAHGLADWLRTESLLNPLSVLGWLYVMEGSSMGGLHLAPLVEGAFRLRPAEGTAYLRRAQSRGEQVWLSFSERVDALEVFDATRQTVLRAAVELFARLEAVLHALWPFQREDLVHQLGAINPEAGRHPVPADPAELEAALRAADACWQRFPYLEMRYGARGRRFTRSDSGWLATLAGFDSARIEQQVFWLARVLAARGLPPLIQAVSLEILASELKRSIPQRAADYERLAQAGRSLRRCSLPEGSEGQRLAEEFNHQAGEPRIEAGELIVSAVWGEQHGYEGAQSSLMEWIGQSGQFSSAWREAALACVAKVEALAACRHSDAAR